MSDHDAQSAIHRFIFEDAIEDEDSNDDEEDVNSKESQNTTWKQLKAKIETQARSQAKIQPLEHKDLPELLKRWSAVQKQKQQKTMIGHLVEEFGDWHSMLINKFHLAFYGLGSTKELLEYFVTKELSPTMPTVIVNGYYPMLTLSDVLQTICSKIMQGYYGLTGVPSSLEARLAAVSRFFTGRHHSLVIVVHCVDELARTNPSLWNAICNQIAVPSANIHLIVSVNHHYSPVFIPSTSMPFLWIACPTGSPYDKELSFRSHMASSSASTDPSQLEAAALTTLASLSERAVLIFCFFANLAIKDDTTAHGVPFQTLLDKVRLTEPTEMKTFETHLNHFEGYHLLKLDRKTSIITTPLSVDALRKIIDKYADVWVLYAEELT